MDSKNSLKLFFLIACMVIIGTGFVYRKFPHPFLNVQWTFHQKIHLEKTIIPDTIRFKPGYENISSQANTLANHELKNKKGGRFYSSTKVIDRKWSKYRHSWIVPQDQTGMLTLQFKSSISPDFIRWKPAPNFDWKPTKIESLTLLSNQNQWKELKSWSEEEISSQWNYYEFENQIPIKELKFKVSPKEKMRAGIAEIEIYQPKIIINGRLILIVEAQLSNAVQIKEGEILGSILFKGKTFQKSINLIAGSNVSEWAYFRPQVFRMVQHSLPAFMRIESNFSCGVRLLSQIMVVLPDYPQWIEFEWGHPDAVLDIIRIGFKNEYS